MTTIRTPKVALLPDEDAATVVQDNKPLAAHTRLNSARDRLIVTTDYSSMIEATRLAASTSLFWPGVLHHRQGQDERRQSRHRTVCGPSERRVNNLSVSHYRKCKIPESKVADLKGKNYQVAFGDRASTSSHFAPKYTMMQSGVQPRDDYKENFTGAHDSVARNELGNAQVGGLSRVSLNAPERLDRPSKSRSWLTRAHSAVPVGHARGFDRCSEREAAQCLHS